MDTAFVAFVKSMRGKYRKILPPTSTMRPKLPCSIERMARITRAAMRQDECEVLYVSTQSASAYRMLSSATKELAKACAAARRSVRAKPKKKGKT
jgi:hypothetical protein